MLCFSPQRALERPGRLQGPLVLSGGETKEDKGPARALAQENNRPRGWGDRSQIPSGFTGGGAGVCPNIGNKSRKRRVRAGGREGVKEPARKQKLGGLR